MSSDDFADIMIFRFRFRYIYSSLCNKNIVRYRYSVTNNLVASSHAGWERKLKMFHLYRRQLTSRPKQEFTF